MICKSHAIYCLLLLCSLLLLLCSCLHYCAARDTITAGNPINSTSNETLISDGKRFELRFLNISGHRYVGIQYYTWRPPEIVWVFNRDNPLPDSATGFFGIINGNLTLWNESRISYFSISLGSSRSTAKLLDSGNLVVRDDQSGKSLWESFNHPTDTFLPGMNRSDPRDRCSVYNVCGNFGSCNINRNDLWLCKCLPGFEPSSLAGWDPAGPRGCTRKSPICAGHKDVFLNLTMMKVGKQGTPLSEVQNETRCRQECLRNCHCQAYSYNEANNTRTDGPRQRCWIWTSDLSDLQEEHPTDGYNISVRVVASSIGSTNKSCETCGTNIIPYPLSTGPNCGDPMYFNFFCNFSTGQVSFRTLEGTFRVNNINPDAHEFAIKVKDEDCVAKNSKYLQLSPASPFYASNLCNPGKRSRNGNEVVFVWKSPPLETPCTSDKDCKDWPNLSCTAPSGEDGLCHCNANYQWNRTALACTQVGSNPVQSGGSGQFGSSEKKHKSISLKTKFIFIVVFFIFVLLCIICLIFYRRRMAARRRESRERREGNQVLQMYDMERSVKNFLDSSEFKEDDKKGIDVPVFDLESILEATNYFSDENKLGQGGFGPVYKGKFPGGKEIAIKRLSTHSGQGLEEFKNEVVLIAKLQHRNLVRLLGYCVKGDEKILLYEYMPNKSLDTFIFDQTLCLSLDWKKRFDIILGIARGLLYLHQDSRLRIIHRDLKTSNILLDEEMNPKISDFGLARIVKGKETEANTMRIVGTYGYMSPEYALDGLFSVKSDVFSFGVIVLEIVSGKRNTGFYQSKEALNLLGYAWRLWNEEKALDLMDRTLVESYNRGEVLKCINVGFLCVQEDPRDRPNVSNVLSMLTGEAATPLPNPKEPAFVAKKWISSRPPYSFDKPETSSSNNEMTVSTEPGR